MNDPLLGRVLDGRYRVTARVAAGGMATVYRAADLRLDREVAVKVMHPSLAADEDFTARFIREAKAAARLSHPNVVNVFDQGHDGGVTFLAMDYVEGRTLRELLQDLGLLTPREAFGVLEPVLAALSAAHRAGFVHRDVKPENILISDDGGIKVADFGLARATASSASAATGKVLVGTVAYLAPEQVERGEASPRTDVYAAGVVLYEMLTGRQPHSGSSAVEVIYKHVHSDVPAPSTVVTGLPQALDALVLAATSREVQQRPVDAEAMLTLTRRTRHQLTDAELDFGSASRVVPPPRPHGAPGEAASPGASPGSEDGTAIHSFPDFLTAQESTGVAGEKAGDQSAAVDDPQGVSTTREVELPPELQLIGLPSERDFDSGSYPQYHPPGPGPAHAAAKPAGTTTPAGHGAPPGRAGHGRSRGGWRPTRGQILLVVVLLLAAGIGGGAWWYGSGRYSDVPAVVNKPRASAEKQIKGADLKVRVESEFSEAVPAGSVIRTDPEAGKRLLHGSTVTLHLSDGPERHTVPALAGLTLDQAKQALAKAQLTLGQVDEIYSGQPQGQVLSSEPPVNAPLPRDTAVRLTVSKGPAPVDVPNVVGRSVQDAQAMLAQSGPLNLVVSPEPVFSPNVPPNMIAVQTPPAGGAKVPAGSTITVQLSKGPDLVKVPNVKGQDIDAAKTALTAAGLTPDAVALPVGPRNVVNQSVPADSMVPRGTKVTIWVL